MISTRKIFLFVLFAIPGPAALAGDIAGTVGELRGAVTAGAGAETRPLQSGAEVFIGDTVKTGSGALVVLKLGQRTTLKLGADTNIEIDRYLADAGGEIDLLAGAILFERTGPPASDPLTIKSAYGLIAVRGTRFYAGPSNGKFGVLVGTGRVEVTGGEKKVSVGWQEGTDVESPGAQPTDPKRWALPRIRAMQELFK